jgi:hypothetical protein
VSDIAQRLVKAAAEYGCDHAPDVCDDCQRIASEVTVVVLRELDRIYHDHDSSFEQLDVAALADEIDTTQEGQ